MTKTVESAKVDNVFVIGNAIELGTRILMEVAGNDIGNTLNGQVLTPELLNGVGASIVQRQLSSRMSRIGGV